DRGRGAGSDVARHVTVRAGPEARPRHHPRPQNDITCRARSVRRGPPPGGDRRCGLAEQRETEGGRGQEDPDRGGGGGRWGGRGRGRGGQRWLFRGAAAAAEPLHPDRYEPVPGAPGRQPRSGQPDHVQPVVSVTVKVTNVGTSELHVFLVSEALTAEGNACLSGQAGPFSIVPTATLVAIF